MQISPFIWDSSIEKDPLDNKYHKLDILKYYVYTNHKKPKQIFVIFHNVLQQKKNLNLRK